MFPLLCFCCWSNKRCIELFEIITGDKFIASDISDLHNRIKNNVDEGLMKINS